MHLHRQGKHGIDAHRRASREFDLAAVCFAGYAIPMERRLGFVGIIVENRARSSPAVNEILSEHGELILARVGLPHRERGCSVITLVVEAGTDELGRLTGRLGQVAGVSVKSGLSKQ